MTSDRKVQDRAHAREPKLSGCVVRVVEMEQVREIYDEACGLSGASQPPWRLEVAAYANQDVIGIIGCDTSK